MKMIVVVNIVYKLPPATSLRMKQPATYNYINEIRWLRGKPSV